VRWAGGLPFLLQELGISRVYDLHSFGNSSSNSVDGSIAATVPPCSRIMCIITGFLWDQEASILSAARALKAREIVVGSAASEAAHRSAIMLSPALSVLLNITSLRCS
jgi:hypothetical protein